MIDTKGKRGEGKNISVYCENVSFLFGEIELYLNKKQNKFVYM